MWQPAELPEGEDAGVSYINVAFVKMGRGVLGNYGGPDQVHLCCITHEKKRFFCRIRE